MTDKFNESQLNNWRTYEAIRASGLFNMFDPQARGLTNMSGSEWVFCMKHYAELKQAATTGETA
jgi:hypothetical protein